MTVLQLADGVRWYVEARKYPSALMAKRAWELAERKLTRRPGDEGVGVTRLGPNPESGAIPSGMHPPKPAVIVVTRSEHMLKQAQRLLGGEAWEPAHLLLAALIARRVEIEKIEKQAGGRVIMRRPEGKGARIYTDGRVVEQSPGQG
jgi:hypothetical protein